MAEAISRLTMAQLPAAERQAIMKNLVISHDRLDEAREALKRFHLPVDGGVPDTGTLAVIIGDSRTGKTFATSTYAKDHPARQGEAGMIFPVLVVETSATGGMRPVLENMANALGMLHSQRMNNALLTNKILDALQYHQVELLVFDEFQDVCDARNIRLASDVKRLLRKILNLDSLNVVCIGLPETYDILANDRQLVGRGGLPHVHLHPYTWDSEEERMSFRLLCHKFDEGMPFAELSSLGRAKTAERLHWVSEGIIGKLKNFLFSAGCLASNDGSANISYEHLALAYDWIKPPRTTFNPFRDEWSLRPAADVNAKPIRSGNAFSKKVAVDA